MVEFSALKLQESLNIQDSILFQATILFAVVEVMSLMRQYYLTVHTKRNNTATKSSLARQSATP